LLTASAIAALNRLDENDENFERALCHGKRAAGLRYWAPLAGFQELSPDSIRTDQVIPSHVVLESAPKPEAQVDRLILAQIPCPTIEATDFSLLQPFLRRHAIATCVSRSFANRWSTTSTSGGLARVQFLPPFTRDAALEF
jgi:hypothetical protein